jgi:hypothetical protein
MEKNRIKYAISKDPDKGFTSGPFSSLKEALEEYGREGDCIYEMDSRQHKAVARWDRIGWVEVE